MDLREIVHSAISHINNAKTEIENLPQSGLNANSKAELDQAYQALNHGITHCLGIFGPATIEAKRKL